jgi:hypothetical protein
VVWKGPINVVTPADEPTNIFHGATSPSGPRLPRYRGFTIILRQKHSIGLLLLSDTPNAKTSTWQYTTLTTDKHPTHSGIRTRTPSKLATADSRLRPRCHNDRPSLTYVCFWRDSPQWARAFSFTRALITNKQAPHSVGLLWTSDELVAETSTWQHRTLTTDKHPWPRWKFNPQRQQTHVSDRTATGISTN